VFVAAGVVVVVVVVLSGSVSQDAISNIETSKSIANNNVEILFIKTSSVKSCAFDTKTVWNPPYFPYIIIIPFFKKKVNVFFSAFSEIPLSKVTIFCPEICEK
jgi:hypothetical protein